MQIVIDLPNENYQVILTKIMLACYGCRITELPKGHGDLIDVNKKITIPTYDEQYEEWSEKTLTVRDALNRWSDEGISVKDVVIPADKAESEDGE